MRQKRHMRKKHCMQQGLLDEILFSLFSPHDCYTHASFANIPNVRMFFLINEMRMIFPMGSLDVFKKDIDVFKEMVSTWI